MRVEALLTVAGFRLGLWLLPFRTFSRLERAGAEGPVPSAVVRAVVAAARRVPYSTCLVEALATQAMLGRRGIGSRVRLGVARAGAGLEAHAWLEDGAGRPIGDSRSALFEKLA
ncbi:MAG: hypothetical protein NVS9B1_18350 [Candidatus Dormibacteraceae bacterium]